MATSAPDVKARAAQLITDDVKMLIGGEWVNAQSGGTFKTFDPGTGVELADIPSADAADVAAAVAAARAALPAWRAMSPTERATLLWRFGDLIDEHLDELSVLESLDNGKPL